MPFGTSRYTKQNHGVVTTVATNDFNIVEIVANDQPRQIKNIRGLVVVGDSVVSPNLNKGGGYMFLFKWPHGVTLPAVPIDLQDPRVLHPVAYAFYEYPVTVSYEFRGINLTEHDSLYFGLQNALGGGTHGFAFELLFALKLLPPTG